MEIMKKTLITGGGGFLGKAVAKQLLEKHIQVISFSRKHYQELDALGVQQIQGDLTDKKSVMDAVKGVDTVFHVAARAGIWGDYQDFYQTNVQGTYNVICACTAHQVKTLVYTSSPSVVFDGSDVENEDESLPYPDKYLAPYPETKALAEKEILQAAKQGLPTIILRPHLIWGPGDNHLVPGILKRAGKLKIIGRKDDLVDTVYVDNAATAHILAAQALEKDPSLSGNIYFISQDDPISKWELANEFLKAADLPPISGHVPAKIAYGLGWICEWLYRGLKIQKEPPLTRFAAKELGTSHWFDISRAKKDLGYQPLVSTAQGLEKLATWLARQKR